MRPMYDRKREVPRLVYRSIRRAALPLAMLCAVSLVGANARTTATAQDAPSIMGELSRTYRRDNYVVQISADTEDLIRHKRGREEYRVAVLHGSTDMISFRRKPHTEALLMKLQEGEIVEARYWELTIPTGTRIGMGDLSNLFGSTAMSYEDIRQLLMSGETEEHYVFDFVRHTNRGDTLEIRATSKSRTSGYASRIIIIDNRAKRILEVRGLDRSGAISGIIRYLSFEDEGANSNRPRSAVVQRFGRGDRMIRETVLQLEYLPQLPRRGDFEESSLRPL